MSGKIAEFLRRHNMHYDAIDLDLERGRLVAAMRDGLAGRPSSLMMIPSFISVGHKAEEGKEVLVLDAGGTNFRVATAKKESDGSVSILNFQKYPMPGRKKSITVEEFF